MATFVSRLIGAAMLDAATYEEVEADRTATRQAAAVVILSSLATGIGAVRSAHGGAGSLVGFSLIALMLWVIWASLTFQIGSKILPGAETRTSIGELLRTIGFASAPGIARVFAVIPGTTPVIFGVTTIWMLMAVIVAVRQALDYTSTARAVAVCVLGFVLAAAFALVIGLLFGPRLSGFLPT
jgi:hypothetical protein